MENEDFYNRMKEVTIQQAKEKGIHIDPNDPSFSIFESALTDDSD